MMHAWYVYRSVARVLRLVYLVIVRKGLLASASRASSAGLLRIVHRTKWKFVRAGRSVGWCYLPAVTFPGGYLFFLQLSRVLYLYFVLAW